MWRIDLFIYVYVTLPVHVHGQSGLCANVIDKAKYRPLSLWGFEPGISPPESDALATEPPSRQILFTID